MNKMTPSKINYHQTGIFKQTVNMPSV